MRWAVGEKVGDEIDERSVVAGWRLAEWYANETKRIYGIFAETEEQSLDRRLLDFIQRREGTVSVRDVQTGCRWIETADDARTANQRLVDAGYGEWQHPKPGKSGGGPTAVFRLFTASPVCNIPPDDIKKRGSADADGADDSNSGGAA